MKGVLIRMKEGHVIDGEGESLGNDATGQPHTYWRSGGELEVPLDLALKLECERPQRYEIKDRSVLKGLILPKEQTPPPAKEEITLKQLQDMTKDELNDWAAERSYELNPGRQNKDPMINSLVKQIEKVTGEKVN